MIDSAERRIALGALIVFTALVGWDLSRPPSAQWSATVLLRAIDLYQIVASPALERAGVRCRFQPSCSLYAERVIERRGTVAGGWAALSRIARCGPWTPEGTLDLP